MYYFFRFMKFRFWNQQMRIQMGLNQKYNLRHGTEWRPDEYNMTNVQIDDGLLKTWII